MPIVEREFEAGLLGIVDSALSSPQTTETFRIFTERFQNFHAEGLDRATAHVKHLVTTDNLLNLPPEYEAALDELLPFARSVYFADIEEQIGWTVCDEFELNEQDRKDGYRSLPEFWAFLRDRRASYRTSFGR
jgi:hypothetical protein